MKLLDKESITVIRVEIVQRHEKCRSITIVDEPNVTNVSNTLKGMIPRQINISIDPLSSLPVVTVRCYTQKGGNTKSKKEYKSFTVTGMTPDEIKELFIKELS